MVAPANQVPAPKPSVAWQRLFVRLLPAIITHASIVLRRLKGDNRDDMIEEVVANACVACARLAQLNKLDLAYPSALARFGLAQALDGRRVGARLNVRDVSSEYAQKAKGIRLQRLDHYDESERCWKEILIPDRTCTPAELAASRIDVPAWFDTLKPRDHKIALQLAVGERTSDVAQRFHLTAGRIAQLRRALHAAWQRFHGEPEPPQAAAVPA